MFMCKGCLQVGKWQMDGVVKFYALELKIALGLALAGTLKDATLSMAQRAAHAQQHEMMLYSKFTRMLTAPRTKPNHLRNL